MNYASLKDKFDTDGYFILKNQFDIDTKLIIKDILNAKDTEVYFDNKNILRRVEKLFNKSPRLIELNTKILELLEEIFGTEMSIFKDKYNCKPQNGEGFYAHYDGIFTWNDINNNEKKGWYEYTDFFVNVLIALDFSNESNGTIEIAKVDNLDFDHLIANTRRNGTPQLTSSYEAEKEFLPIELKAGDMVIFSHKCPHRSKKNLSSKDRRILYYTYNIKSDGDFYEKYFSDKKTSNPGVKLSKALSK